MLVNLETHLLEINYLNYFKMKKNKILNGNI